MKEWAQAKLHVSWHIAGISLGILLGVLGSLVLPAAEFAHDSMLAIVAVLVFLVFLKRHRWLLILGVFAGMLLGLWRGSFAYIGGALYQNFIGSAVTVQGTVAEDVGYGAGDKRKIRLDHIRVQDQPLGGQIWLSVTTNLEIKRSDHLRVQGFMQDGFGSFSATLVRAKIVSVERADYGDVARDVRDSFAAGVGKAIKQPEADLGIGFLTGKRSSLPPDLDEQLKIVGLTHVVVASGYNLTILVRATRRIFARLSKYLTLFAGGSLICGFVLVTGFSPSMSRAGLVAGLSLLAWYYGRVVHPVVLLLFVAALTALINPFFVWGDIGWYLSFVAFVGVIMLAPLVQSYFWGDKKPGVLRQILVDTSCAQLLTLPIMAFAFGHYSLYALPANLFILPLIPLAMLLTFIAGLTGLILPAVASLIGWPAQLLLQYMTQLVNWIANQPGAQGDIAFSPILLGLSYAALLGVMLWLVRATKHSFRADTII